MTTLERVQEVIADQLGIDKDSITMESDLIEGLKADSLEIAEMLFMLEEEFDISLDEENALNLKTAGDVVALIDRLTNK